MRALALALQEPRSLISDCGVADLRSAQLIARSAADPDVPGEGLLWMVMHAEMADRAGSATLAAASDAYRR